jgi:hypothetical protein
MAASTLDARRRLNGSVCQEASRLLERYDLDANELDPTLCPSWEEFSELLNSELLNGPIKTNYQFIVRTLNRLVNHEVGLPNNESRTERNIHKSQRPTWTANELHSGISALPAVVVDLTRFMDLWKDAFADEEDATPAAALAPQPQPPSSEEEEAEEDETDDEPLDGGLLARAHRQAFVRATGVYVRHERLRAQRCVLRRVRTRFEAFMEDLEQALEERPARRRRTARPPCASHSSTT